MIIIARAGKDLSSGHDLGSIEEMEDRRLSNGVAAAIRPQCTDSAFHLQVYASVVWDDGRVAMLPGLRATLSNAPYQLILQR